MRLIDAEWLLDLYQGLEGLNTPINAVVQNIKDAPTVDAVEADLHTDGTLWIKIDHLKGVVAIKNVVLSCSRWCATFVHEEDAVEVVRCRECKWYKAHMMPKTVKCLIYSKDDDYCSYGERHEK